MSTAPFRRIVTGHNAAGLSVIQEAAPPPRVAQIGVDGPVFHEVWSTLQTPALIDADSGEPPEQRITLAPPQGGTRIRVLDIPPEEDSFSLVTADQARAHFAAIGAADALAQAASRPVRHAFMHRTETVDYGIVIDGELVLIMDEGEVTVRAGDIVIQRGTNHGWANRSKHNCRIAFILIDGKFADGLE